MNQNTNIVPKQSIETVGINKTGAGMALAPETLGEVVRFADVMARAGKAVPEIFRGDPGACLAVTMQALQWEMNPFSVAQKAYFVNNTIAYESQLITAVVNTRSGIKGRLKYHFTGEGQDLSCRVVGIIDGEEYDYQSPKLKDIRPQNSPLWKSDPQQQLGYYSARAWARRHVPEVLMGVYDREEVESFRGPDNARNVTPASMSERYLNKGNQLPVEEPTNDEETAHTTTEGVGDGFNEQQIDMEIDSMGPSEEVVQPSDVDGEGGEKDVSGSDSPQPLIDEDKPLVARYLKHCVTILDKEGSNMDKLRKYQDEYKRLMAGDLDKLTDNGKAVCDMMKENFTRILEGKVERETTLEFYNEMLGTELT